MVHVERAICDTDSLEEKISAFYLRLLTLGKQFQGKDILYPLTGHGQAVIVECPSDLFTPLVNLAAECKGHVALHLISTDQTTHQVTITFGIFDQEQLDAQLRKEFSVINGLYNRNQQELSKMRESE